MADHTTAPERLRKIPEVNGRLWRLGSESNRHSKSLSSQLFLTCCPRRYPVRYPVRFLASLGTTWTSRLPILCSVSAWIELTSNAGRSDWRVQKVNGRRACASNCRSKLGALGPRFRPIAATIAETDGREMAWKRTQDETRFCVGDSLDYPSDYLISVADKKAPEPDRASRHRRPTFRGTCMAR